MFLMSGALAEVNAADLLVCNPLGVATNSSGKHRRVHDILERDLSAKFTKSRSASAPLLLPR